MVVATPSSLRQVPVAPICAHCAVGRLLVVEVDWQIAWLLTTFFGLEIEKLPPPSYSSPMPNRKCPDSCNNTHGASPNVVCVVPEPPPSEIEAQSRKASRCRIAVPSNAAMTVDAGVVKVRVQPLPSAPAGPAHRLNRFFQVRGHTENWLLSVKKRGLATACRS